MNKNKKTVMLTIIGMLGLLLTVIGATYAYFRAQMGTGTDANINALSGTTDSLTFKSSKDITINATSDNFKEKAGNLSDEATLTATLIANSANQTAVYKYNLYIEIPVNQFTYTVNESTPELLLNFYDEKDQEIKTIKNLEYKTVTDGKGEGQSGYDITTKTGLIELDIGHIIEATPETNGQKIDTWKVKVTLINLGVDQNKNAGKMFSARLIMQGEKLNVYNNDLASTTYRSSEYRDLIKNVYFVDYIDKDLESKVDKWDLSTSQDETIMGWLENNNDKTVSYNLYIGSNSPIVVTSFKEAFSNMLGVETIDLGDNLDTSLMTNTSYMFYGTKNLVKIDGIEELKTNCVTNMSYMFNMALGLTELNLSNWDVSNVTNMNNIFNMIDTSRRQKSQLTTIDISNWDTSNVENMSHMFDMAVYYRNVGGIQLSQLTTIDISNWDTYKVIDMNSMFYASALTTIIGIENLKTNNVKDMSNMFNGTTGLTELNLSNWDVSNVTNMESMFSSNSAVEKLNLNDWITSSVTNMSNMFESAFNLNDLKMNKATFTNVSSYENMFEYHNSELKITTNIEAKGWLLERANELSSTPLLTEDNFIGV